MFLFLGIYRFTHSKMSLILSVTNTSFVLAVSYCRYFFYNYFQFITHRSCDFFDSLVFFYLLFLIHSSTFSANFTVEFCRNANSSQSIFPNTQSWMANLGLLGLQIPHFSLQKSCVHSFAIVSLIPFCHHEDPHFFSLRRSGGKSISS